MSNYLEGIYDDGVLKGALSKILGEFPNEIVSIFKENRLASYIRHEAVAAVQNVLGSRSKTLLVEGSAGAGRWADVPWITIMDPRVTESPTRGYYVVFLFNWRRQQVVLSLNQGSTQVGAEFGAKRDAILAERAARMRARLAHLSLPFDTKPIDLNARTPLGRSYEPGHALGVTYDLATMPHEETLRSHLSAMVEAYLVLFSAGGMDASASEEDDALLDERPQAGTVVEQRLYRAHRSIERRPGNAKKVKAHHGLTCQACGLNFEHAYGPLGSGYIEAHHLLPLSTLAVGIETQMSVAEQFCVLCANCHRMIHRQEDPADLAGLRLAVKAARQP